MLRMARQHDLHTVTGLDRVDPRSAGDTPVCAPADDPQAPAPAVAFLSRLVDAVDHDDVRLIAGTPGQMRQRVGGGAVKNLTLKVEDGPVTGTEKLLATRVESV